VYVVRDVVMWTSSQEERNLIEGYEQGVNNYIIKPVDFTQFREAVRQIGFYWLVVNQPPVQKRYDAAPGGVSAAP
jgi:two-component system, response regulator